MNTLRQAAQAAEDFLDRRWRKTGACDDDIREHAEALRAALAEPQPELAEFVLVPREPTPEMVGAMAVEESTGTINGISTLGMAGACLAWESALAAAPKAQQPRPEPVAWTGDPSTQDYTSTQPEPVAEVYDTFGNTQDPTKCSGHVWLAPGYFPPRGTKLYAAPQAQQHDCERRPYGDLRNAKWLDPECYAKGACQSLIFKQAQQPQPEPYCYIYEYDSVLGLHREFYPRQWNGYLPSRAVPLYATPQPELSSSELGNVKQPLKERPDFIAGYTAGLADGKACAERDAEPFNAKADRLRIAGVTLIGLAEHDQRCDVFGLDDDGRHMACSCGLDESVKIIAEAAHWTRGE